MAQSETATRVAGLIFGLRRVLQRKVGRTGGVSDLSDAQRDLVRLVRLHPGIRVGEAAAELQLAGNTVSTLVSTLCSSGWLIREKTADDARVTSLTLTPEAMARVAEWRDRRAAVLADALDALGAEDRDAIDRALPALIRLRERLQQST